MNLFGEKESEKIMALSWKEPFATMMLLGKIETRSWHTNYRGKVLICASKKAYSESEIMNISGEVQTQNLLVTLNRSGLKEKPGFAIATGILSVCRNMVLYDEAKTFVKFKAGLWCHIYYDVKPIKPFLWNGCQGWKKLSEETINKIEYL